MRGSGSAGSMPVATLVGEPAVGAPPVPVAVPDVAPTLTVGGGIGGRVVGITDGARMGAGTGVVTFFGFALGAAPFPTVAAPRGWTCTYVTRSVCEGVFSAPKNADGGYVNVIDASSAMRIALATSETATDPFCLGPLA